MVTGMTPQQVEQQGVSEREFFAAIHHELAQPNTCGVGYNSIRFDDEVTRYGLYRNFYDPYAREWEHNNSKNQGTLYVKLLGGDFVPYPDFTEGRQDYWTGFAIDFIIGKLIPGFDDLQGHIVGSDHQLNLEELL